MISFESEQSIRAERISLTRIRASVFIRAFLNPFLFLLYSEIRIQELVSISNMYLLLFDSNMTKSLFI